MKKSTLKLFLFLALAGPILALDSQRSPSNTLTAVSDAVTLEVRKFGSLVVQLTGTWSATITFEATADGTNYVAVPAVNVATGASATTATANGMYILSALGYQNARARVSAYTSGTVVATAIAVEGSGVTTAATASTGTSTLGKAEDAAHASGDVGSMALVVRNDTRGALAGTDGDYAPLQVNSAGDLRVETALETATQGSTQPTAVAAGGVRRAVGSTDGTQYVRQGGPVTWSCGLDAIGTTLTECRAAPGAGLKLYVTSVVVQSTTGTAGQFALQRGTGTNCGTGTAGVLPSATTTARYGSPANTSAPAWLDFSVPLALPANEALCVLGVATNTTTIQITGYTAP